MPKFLEEKLEGEAVKRGVPDKDKDRYIYGTLNNMGAMHGNKETQKGRAMDAKHAADQRRPSLSALKNLRQRG